LKFIVALISTAVGLVFLGNAAGQALNAARINEKLAALKVHPDFHISLFAGHLEGQNLASARLMTVGPDGNLYLSLTRQNKVVMLPDVDQDGIADEVVTVYDQGLNKPHGLVFVGSHLYIANQDGVIKLNQTTWPASGATPIIENLPTGGHKLKTLHVGPDAHFYLNIGSSCNVCDEQDATRATIVRYTLEGKPAGALVTLGRHAQSAIWAHGLRNSQGFAWHPVSKAMFATNNGADNRSQTKGGRVDDNLPPEHFNQIERGKHYGWPYCWGDQFQDPNFVGKEGFCQSTTPPQATFTSHSTPMGFAFLHQAKVPAAFKSDAIVAQHGSWNRQQPSGYALRRLRFNAQHQPVGSEAFVTGWLEGSHAWGRPVDVVVGNDRAIYVSDDKMGVIYRMTKK